MYSILILSVYMKIEQPPLCEIPSLQTKFPDFVIGFDLVGQEDLGRPLIDFADQILTLPPTIKFFFHAGETNWGGQTDDNLVSNDFKSSLFLVFF